MGKELKYNLNFNLEHNSIVCGDCEEWLKFIPKNSIDLIYIDPPFFSNQNYEIIWGNGYEKRSFDDRWKGSIDNYIEWMEPKIKEAYRVLKNTGSIFLHCNYRADAELKILLKKIFENNFQNEIVCLGSLAKRPPDKRFQDDIQKIYWFSKKKNYKNNPDKMRKETRIKTEDVKKDYKEYGNGITGYDLPQGDYTEKTLKQKEKEGLAFKTSNGKWRVIKPLKKVEGGFLRDDKRGNIWTDLKRIDHLPDEKIGYKTQKTEALIKRIIECCTNENDMVLDFFGGGGTTAKVCADLKRRFITGDVSPVAVRVIADRLLSQGYNDYDIKVTADRLLAYRNKGYEVKFLPSTKEEFLKLNDKKVFGTEGSHWFAKMICEFKGWDCNQKKSNDKGIDGLANKGKVAIQIKNHSSKIGRPDIQRFFGAVSGKYEEGIFVAWDFSKEAEEYRAGKKGVIKFLKIEDIIGSTLLGKDDTRLLPEEKRIKHQELFYKGVSKKIERSPFHGQEKVEKTVSASEQEIGKEMKKSQRKRKQKAVAEKEKLVNQSVKNTQPAISSRNKSTL